MAKVWKSFRILPKIIIDLLSSFVDKIGSSKQSLKPCYIYNNCFKYSSSGISSFHKFLSLENNNCIELVKMGGIIGINMIIGKK